MRNRKCKRIDVLVTAIDLVANDASDPQWTVSECVERMVAQHRKRNGKRAND
jgi:hypothetical protein